MRFSVLFLLLAALCALLIVVTGSTVYNGLSLAAVVFLGFSVGFWLAEEEW